MSRPLPPLEPRARVSDLDYVYSQLSRSIMMGEFEPGQKLKLNELASAFQTSHMPVREALSRLTVAKVLQAEPRRSVYVPHIDRKRLEDLLNIRIELECMALRAAAAKPNPELASDLAKINGKLEAEAMSDRPNFKDYLAANHEFHFAIYNACGNPDLTSLIELMWMRYGPFLHLIRSGNTEFGKHEHHNAIIDGIRKGNASDGCIALERDLREAAVLIRKTLPGTEPA